MKSAAVSPKMPGLRRTVRAQRKGLFWRWTAFRRSFAERPGAALSAAAFVLAGIVAIATGVRGFRGLAQAEALRETLAGEVRSLRARSAGLDEAIGHFRNDPAVLELQARTHHDLVEPGETVVLLRFAEPVGPTAPAPARPAPPPEGP